MAEAPQEAEACWTCGGDWDECQHDHSPAADVCGHLSESGDEGPMRDLGRWPTRWRCDGCGRVRHEDPCLCDECKSGDSR